jgi:exonuclease III
MVVATFVLQFCFSMIEFKDLSILAWNVRGFANKKSWNHMHDLIRRYSPDVIFLFETHTLFSSSESFWNREGYEKIEIQEVQGQAGGIWVIQRRGIGFDFPLSVKCTSV